jgi:sulfatase maturation enzyme AslB (radical SAM superfamily)
LTNDQKGWAKADHFDHYTHELSRWRKVKGKASKVVPAKLAFQVRDLLYRSACDCETPKYVLWGHRWDLTPLHQCHNCGEVIVKPPRVYGNLHTTDDNNTEEQHDDTDEPVVYDDRAA